MGRVAYEGTSTIIEIENRDGRPESIGPAWQAAACKQTGSKPDSEDGQETIGHR
jgi:hypothetical protein